MTFKGFWKISDDSLKKVVEKCYLNNEATLNKMHANIAKVMTKTGSSIRKLEEQTAHYYAAKEYFTLKQTLGEIENFL